MSKHSWPTRDAVAVDTPDVETPPARPGRLGRAVLRVAGNAIAALSRQPGLVVVSYHRVLARPDPMLESEPDLTAFRWQMALLAECFNVMPLYDALRALDEGRLPPRTVCITFDDGYRSVYDLALPVLREFGLPATVFVTSGFVGKDAGNMWNDRIIHAVQSLPAGTLDLSELGLERYTLGAGRTRREVAATLIETAKYLPPLGRHALVERLDQLSGMGQDPLMLTAEMLSALDRNGVEIGAHTISHPILTSLDDDSARDEIAAGKAQLEAIIGKPVRLFAYPNGKVGKDFNARHVEMVRAAGYFAAFTTAVGAVTPSQDRFQLPRSRPWDRSPFRYGLRLLSWIALGNRNDARQTSNKDHPMHKPALLIAFHFPPQASSSGVQRSLCFSRHLGKHGWNPMVLSAHPRAYPVQNPSQLASVPSDLVVARSFTIDTKRHLGVGGRYPGLLALPDRWVSWCFSAVPAGLRLVKRHRPRVIWSTFPLASAHLIGLALQRLTGLPWVADFRDPMIQPAYPSNGLQRKVYAWIEGHTIRRCHTAVFTTHSAADSYRARFPEQPPEKFVTIENGYDEDSFGSAEARPRPAGRPLTLLHSGVLYDAGRDPSAFLQALRRLKDEGRANAASLRVVLRAPGPVASFEALVARHDVADIVSIAPSAPYREALQEMLEADGLLVFQGTPFNTQLPAKVYEYFRARKPILGLLDKSGETARVLRAAGFNDLADMDDPADIALVLGAFLEQLASGRAHIASPALVASSSREHRARQLAAVFDAAIGQAQEQAARKVAS
jgi:peptidoglycan/xylan/chitin deacetylase (PgdA/CDA1 family)